MTDAPERIHLDGDSEAGEGMFPRCFENPKYCSEPAIEYIRADLVEALEAENQRLRASLQECLEIVDRATDKRAYRALKTRARAALRSTEASHDD